MLLFFNKDYKCNDHKLIEVYLYILSGIHLFMCLIEVIIIMLSASGTIANPAPRKNIAIVLYIEAVVFVLKLGWDIVGVMWVFDKSIKCDISNAFLLLSRLILIWNLLLSTVMASYAIFRICLCRMFFRMPTKEIKYDHHTVDVESSEGRGLTALSSAEFIKKHRQSTWKWRLQWLLCGMRLRGEQRNAFNEIASTMTDAFVHFRGYVPSDVAAGIALLAMEQRSDKV